MPEGAAFSSPPGAGAAINTFAEAGKKMVHQVELTAPGPMGALKGTLTLPSQDAPLPTKTPVLLIVPDSGPT
ncbi:MAG: hypothetical protein B7Z38_04040, partial [Rhodobacterales bacterium 12-64-8]